MKIYKKTIDDVLDDQLNEDMIADMWEAIQ
jgi:hypothetical protein